MTRVKRGIRGIARRSRITKLAKGFQGRRKNLLRTAKEAVDKALSHAYAHRRLRKRDSRKLWITRINAAARQEGMSYSRLIDGLTKANVTINRKMLSEMAIHNPQGFNELVNTARQTLSEKN